MRILLTNNFFLPRTSGSTHFTVNLATELASRGHDVVVATCTPGAETPDLPFEVVRLAAWPVNFGRFSFGYEIPFCSPRGVRRLRSLLRSFDPDVVHVNEQFFDLSYWAGLWARRRQVPCVMTLHTAFTHNVPWIHRFLRAVDGAGVAPLLALSDPTLVTIDKFIARYAGARFPGRRRRWIPIPVRAGIFSGGDGAAVRERLGIGDRPIVLSLGHAIPLRDRLLLVEALPALEREVPGICVVVVGKVHDDRFLLRARELGVDHAVIAVGEVPHDEVRDFVAAAQVECHETQGYGLGTASLEIMGSGLPVVAVVDEDNFPGVPLEDGTHVVRCDERPESLAKGLTAALIDIELRERVSRGARALVEEWFDLPRVADRYLDLYGEACGRKPRT